jgi:integrase
VKNAKPGEREYLLADGDGLFIRVRPDGAKHWIFLFSLDGAQRKRGLGVYPQIGLKFARELAASCRSLVAKGINPAEAERQASGERRAERLRRSARLTVRGLFEEWLRRELARRKDGGASARRMLEKDIFPRIGERFADEITRRDIQAALDAVADRGVKKTVNILRGELRQMFAYALNREIITADPTATIRKLVGADNERTRVLTPDEIRNLAEKLPASGLSPRFQTAAWIMLATCARVGELSHARWADIDLEVGTWMIPAETAKNSRAHLIHLSDFARHHFAALPRPPEGESDGWVLPGRDGQTPITRQTLQKMFKDRQRAVPLKGRSASAGALKLSGGDWTAHDLRRTGATLMGELRVRGDVIERCLNHIEPNKITRTYQRQELLEDRRQAFRLLGERLNMILNSEAGKVVVFPTG